jgi:hypothetical protein
MPAAVADRLSPAPRSCGRPWHARPWRPVTFESEEALVPQDGFSVDVFVHDEQPSPTFVTNSDARPATDSQ